MKRVFIIFIFYNYFVDKLCWGLWFRYGVVRKKQKKRNICCLVALSTVSMKVIRDIEERKKERGGITISQCALALNNNDDDDNQNNK